MIGWLPQPPARPTRCKTRVFGCLGSLPRQSLQMQDSPLSLVEDECRNRALLWNLGWWMRPSAHVGAWWDADDVVRVTTTSHLRLQSFTSSLPLTSSSSLMRNTTTTTPHPSHLRAHLLSVSDSSSLDGGLMGSPRCDLLHPNLQPVDMGHLFPFFVPFPFSLFHCRSLSLPASF